MLEESERGQSVGAGLGVEGFLEEVRFLMGFCCGWNCILLQV